MTRTLVIETATAVCSVALIENGTVAARNHELVGRSHAERLVPMIASLPGQGRADCVLVDVGPGSFTGVRVGVATAIGLGIGWRVPVHGYSSMALIAATAFSTHPDLPALAVVLEGGHGEVFVQRFARPLTTTMTLRSLSPADALAAIEGDVAFGSGARMLAPFAPGRALHEQLPDSADAILLSPDAAALRPRPIYGRAPDAKPMVAA